MNILIDGSPLKTPQTLLTSWITVGDNLLREVRMEYPCLTEAEAAAVLGATVKPNINLSYRDPKANANIALLVDCIAASAAILREQGGAVTYHPVVLVLREKPAS